MFHGRAPFANNRVTTPDAQIAKITALKYNQILNKIYGARKTLESIFCGAIFRYVVQNKLPKDKVLKSSICEQMVCSQIDLNLFLPRCALFSDYFRHFSHYFGHFTHYFRVLVTAFEFLKYSFILKRVFGIFWPLWLRGCRMMLT